MSVRKGKAVRRNSDPTRTVQAKQATLALKQARAAKAVARTAEVAR